MVLKMYSLTCGKDTLSTEVLKICLEEDHLPDFDHSYNAVRPNALQSMCPKFKSSKLGGWKSAIS